MEEFTIQEIRMKKIVNRRGQIRKQKTAGVKGRKVVNGKVTTMSGSEKNSRRRGSIKRTRTLKAKSRSKKRRSALFATAGRKKRAKMGVRDTRNG